MSQQQVQDWLQSQETQGMPPGFLSARRQTTTESKEPIDWASVISRAKRPHDPNQEPGKHDRGWTYTTAHQIKKDPERQGWTDAVANNVKREAIDPVSGAGVVPPRPVVKKIDTAKKVQPVEPVIRPQAYRSAIGQAISQKDLENMTQQIQVAHKLGDDVNENFDDGKKPGRKGLAKRMGVNCKQPVSKLRNIAKNSSGERARMAHWCANMKSGRAKKK